MALLAALCLQASLSDLLPPESAAITICERPADFLSGLLTGEIGRRARGSALWAALEEQPGFGAALLGWSALSAPVGGEPVAWMRAMAGGGFAAALVPGPDGASPGLVVLTRVGDGAAAERILQQAARLAQTPPRSVEGEHWEVPVGAAVLLRRGDLLAFASSAELAAGVRARAADAGDGVAPTHPPGLEDLRARAAAPGDLCVWVSGALLRADSYAPLPADLGASLLVADLHEALRVAPWAGATLACGPAGLRAEFFTPEPPNLRSTHAPFRPNSGAVALPRVSDTMLRGVLRRDLGGWYNARDQYASEAAVARSVEGDGNLRALFGRDFGPEVLAWLEPQAVFVAARNPDAASRALELELPAAALGLRLKPDAPAGLPPAFVNAFMAAVAFSNFQAGAADDKVLTLDLELTPGGGKIYAARRGPLAPGVSAPLAFNAEPALYIGADGGIWLSSSLGLLRAILAAPADAGAGETSWAELRLGPLADLLLRAHDAILARRLLQNGGDAAEAERFAALLVAGARLMDGAQLQFGPSSGCCSVVVLLHAQPE